MLDPDDAAARGPNAALREQVIRATLEIITMVVWQLPFFARPHQWNPLEKYTDTGIRDWPFNKRSPGFEEVRA